VQRIVERGPLSMTLLTHDSAQRPVAIVALYPGKATEDVVARFVAEARTASQIDSDHVARIYEIGALPDGAPFVALEYVAGTDLGEMVSARGGPLPVAVATDILLQAVDALACARFHGVLQRDLSPASLVLVSQGDGSEVLKVLSFDLSPAADSPAPLPNLFPLRRRAPRSHAYRAPERVLDPGVVDQRADVWSLGAMMFFLVTGAPPFGDGTPTDVLGAIASRSADALRGRLRDLPGPLADAILHCLEPSPDRRFADVAELGEALVPYGTGARTGGARRARAALSRPPPTFVTTMPLQIITAAPPPVSPMSPPPPMALPPPDEIPGFEARTLAFTPTPHAAMLISMTPPPVMAAPPFPMPAVAPVPAPAPTSGPTGTIVAVVAALLAVAIAGAVIGAVLFRARPPAAAAEPLAVDTGSPSTVPPPSQDPVQPAVPAGTAPPQPSATATPVPSEVPSAASAGAPSAEASAVPQPEPSLPPVPPVPPLPPTPAVPSVAATASAAPAATPPRETTVPAPVTLPAPKRPTKSDLLRSRE
jgi:serine/threonine-protein kinase